MKRILLFGKLNGINENINVYLSKYFQVQLCSDNLEIAKGMLKVYVPDLVVISLVGLYDIHTSFFSELYENYKDVKVITIGTEKEKSVFKTYYEIPRFQNLLRPTSNAEIMKQICERLSLDVKELEEEYERNVDSRKHILLVDDDAVFLRNMREILQVRYQVSVAISAAQAMTIMGKKEPDLLILDYDMPICNGKMMMEMIRSEERFKYVPVIFLTGNSRKDHIMEVLDLKPKNYFLKPPVMNELFDAIERALRNSECEQLLRDIENEDVSK